MYKHHKEHLQVLEPLADGPRQGEDIHTCVVMADKRDVRGLCDKARSWVCLVITRNKSTLGKSKD
jgi:hypothetical protein